MSKEVLTKVGLVAGGMMLNGIVGKLVELGDRHAKVEIAKGTVVQMLKSSILELDVEPASGAAAKKDEPSPEKK